MDFAQLFFNFKKKTPDFKEEDFIFHNENKKAQQFLESFFTQKNHQFPSVILKGEESCGKSHLARIFAKKYSAQILNKDFLTQENLSQFFEKNKFYILEDIDKINEDILLFHILNAAFEAQSFLLMTAQNLTNFKLKDLDSRIKNIFLTEIENPQEKMIQMLIVKNFAKKQLKINDNLINFLAKNLNRNYKAINEITEKIENHCHKNKGKISLDDIKNLVK